MSRHDPGGTASSQRALFATRPSANLFESQVQRPQWRQDQTNWIRLDMGQLTARMRSRVARAAHE